MSQNCKKIHLVVQLGFQACLKGFQISRKNPYSNSLRIVAIEGFAAWKVYMKMLKDLETLGLIILYWAANVIVIGLVVLVAV